MDGVCSSRDEKAIFLQTIVTSVVWKPYVTASLCVSLTWQIRDFVHS